MLTMYMLVLALLGMILPSQAIDATYSTSANMPSEYELNVTYLMREKIQFDVWVKRGYTLELALGYSISNVDTINFVDNWPYVTNKYEYTSWNVTDTTNQKRCEFYDIDKSDRNWVFIRAVCAVSPANPGTAFVCDKMT